MLLKDFRQFGNDNRVEEFNMTPIIDIVFQLIIFFAVVSRFIEAENFPVAIPDQCGNAQNNFEPGSQVVTLSVMKKIDGGIDFAVGPEMVSYVDRDELVSGLRRLIDFQLKDLPSEKRVVTLRIDKDICFSDAQYALAAVAQSGARDIQLAALKDRRPQE